jgi:hypothetical protein
MTDKQPVQADGQGTTPATPQGHKPEGSGESGGGAYKHDDTGTGDNREVDRPVNTGRKPEP